MTWKCIDSNLSIIENDWADLAQILFVYLVGMRIGLKSIFHPPTTTPVGAKTGILRFKI